MARRLPITPRLNPSLATSVIFILVFALLIPMAVAWAGFSHQLDLKNIWVLGAQLNTEQSYRDYIGPGADSTLLTLDVDDIVNALENDPYIKGVRISRQFPDALKMEILEREPIAALNTDPIRLVDREGIVLPVTHPELVMHLPMLSNMNPAKELYPLGRQSLSVKVLDAVAIVHLVMDIFPKLYTEISEVRFNANDELELVLTQHPTRIFLGNGQVKEKLLTLREFKRVLPPEILLTSFRSLDLRFNNQIIARDWNS
ncbi:MAG: FtsQ-type POTRA domain-containing protein [FCB group bacterium]|nr:FtsQ-type POTRA domain-containing protein [FCB group bacterium]